MEELTRTGSNMPMPSTTAASKDLVKIQMQHDMKMHDEQLQFEHTTYWESCCLRFDKRAVSYFGQMTIGIGIITFCITMMAMNDDCATFSRFSPLLTLVVGILLPSPQLHRSND